MTNSHIKIFNIILNINIINFFFKKVLLRLIDKIKLEII